MKISKVILFVIALFIISLAGVLYWPSTPEEIRIEVRSDEIVDYYTEHIQPIFNSKCIACHSCYNSPCQLNLTSYAGLKRGANHINIYDFPKFEARKPTRLYVDATTTEEWRKKGFFSVVDRSPQDILSYMIQIPEGIESGLQKKYDAEYSRQCIDSTDSTQLRKFTELNRAGRMPLGFPGLKEQEVQHILHWLNQGAPGPNLTLLEQQVTQSKELRELIQKWETFFNQEGLKEKIVSRYLYEHLFIGSLYFENSSNIFFRLVRSRTQADSIEEISTTLPFDEPNGPLFYRLRPITNSLVHKSHIPFLLSDDKLKTWKKEFLGQNWSSNNLSLPQYGKMASNPFQTFSAIPVEARYKFMLENAAYHIMTFIKGPVCRGQTALNVINDHFWVFFIKPDKDVMVNSAKAYNIIANEIEFPSFAGDDILPLVNFREKYWETIKAKFHFLEKSAPLGIDSLWQGQSNNTNAAITVYRHYDSATVLKGLRGSEPKTVWVLDYQVFESIYYNLVAGYNIFGPVLHQLNSRLYMEVSRVASEDLFLTFLPPNSRNSVRASWHMPSPKKEKQLDKTIISWIAKDLRENFFKNYNYLGQGISSTFAYNKADVVRGFLNKLKSRHLNKQQYEPVSDFHVELSELKNLPGQTARYFPDTIVFEIKDNETNKIWSVIHNKDHYNVGMLLFEDDRRRPEKDSLDVISGIATSYLNLIISLNKIEIKSFISELKNTQTEVQVEKVIKKYGLSRMNPHFWDVYNRISKSTESKLTNEQGALDLNRYMNL